MKFVKQLTGVKSRSGVGEDKNKDEKRTLKKIRREKKTFSK
jgi:hypothetical protein